MTVYDLIEYGEYVLRNDREYQAEIERLKGEIDRLVYRQRAIMGAAIVRLAAAMVTEQSSSKCADCIGGYCEDCMEGKDHDEE